MLLLLLALDQVEVGVVNDILALSPKNLIIQLEVKHLCVSTLKSDKKAIAWYIPSQVVPKVPWGYQMNLFHTFLDWHPKSS